MATKPNTRPRRKAAESPGAGVSGIEEELQARAAEATQKAVEIAENQGLHHPPPAAVAPGSSAAQNSVPAQQSPETAPAAKAPAVAEQQNEGEAKEPIENSGNQEIPNSGLTSGNPETQKSGNQEGSSGGDTGNPSGTGADDYLGMVYEGIIDPYDDFRKTSTQLPPVVSRTLKAAAPIYGTSVQVLLRDILLGKAKPLPESYPGLLERFYQMAQQGKLK